MKSGDCSDKALEKVQSLALVDHAWMADQGSIIVVLDRTATTGSIFQLIDRGLPDSWSLACRVGAEDNTEDEDV